MLDGPLMLRVNWPVVDALHPQTNKVTTGVKIKATGDSRLNISLASLTCRAAIVLLLCYV